MWRKTRVEVLKVWVMMPWGTTSLSEAHTGCFQWLLPLAHIGAVILDQMRFGCCCFGSCSTLLHLRWRHLAVLERRSCRGTMMPVSFGTTELKDNTSRLMEKVGFLIEKKGKSFDGAKRGCIPEVIREGTGSIRYSKQEGKSRLHFGKLGVEELEKHHKQGCSKINDQRKRKARLWRNEAGSGYRVPV